MSRDEDDGDSQGYRELLEELRTIIPGVQVLLAFLLTVPFSSRFTEVDDLGRRVFVAALVGVALAIVVFLTPAAMHRVSRSSGSGDRLRLGVRLTVAGMAIAAASVAAVIFVVVRFIFDAPPLALAVAVSVAAAAVGMWFVLPLLMARDRRR